MSKANLTLLNSMFDEDFERALDKHVEMGIKKLDLRDAIYGHWVADLDLETARKAKDAIDSRGLEVYCLSTGIFFEEIAKGEQVFREEHLGVLKHHIDLAKILGADVFRLTAPQLAERGADQSSMSIISSEYPWVVDVHREAVDRLADAGIRPTIENEASNCILSVVEDFGEFYESLDRSDSMGLTWDVQNHWATGVYPTKDVYNYLKPMLYYYHVKGGVYEDESSKTLKWNAALEDSNWPVVDITQRVVDDGVSPVICINPTQHGQNKPGYDYSAVPVRDIDFLRRSVKGLE